MASIAPTRPVTFNLLRLVLAVSIGILLGSVAVFTTPIIALGALVALFLLVLALRRPEIAILGYVILTSTFFNSSANASIGLPIGHIYLTDLLLAGLLLMIPLRALVEPRFSIQRSPLDIPLWLFVGMAYLATALAMLYKGLQIQQSLGEMRVVASYLLFFGVTNLVRSRKQLDLLIGAILVLACLVGALMVVQYVRGPSTHILAGRVENLCTEGQGCVDITRVIPPGDSIVLVSFIIACALLWIQDSGAPTGWTLLVALVTGLGVLLTFKRHYWAAVVIDMALLMFLYRRRNFERLLLAGMMAVLVAGAAWFYVMNFTGSAGPSLISASVARFTSLANPSTYTDPNSSLQWRAFEGSYAIPQFLAHPFFGIGLGSQYRPLVPPKDWALFDGRAYMHNAHLWILTKTGLFGYLPFAFFLLLGLFRGFRHWRSVRDRGLRALMLGITLAFLGMLIGSWVEPELMEAAWAPVIAIMLGVNEVILSGVLSGAPSLEKVEAESSRPLGLADFEEGADV